MAALLKIEDGGFAYRGEEWLFRHINLEMEAGEIFTLLGPNGAGKSTLLNCILKLLHLKEGVIRINGIEQKEMTARAIARKIAYVRQSDFQSYSYAVKDYIMMGRAPYISAVELPGKKDQAIVKSVMDRMNINFMAERMVDEISGGERQEVSIARAIVQETPIIIMDEPTSALDFGNQVKVLRMMKELSAQGYLIVNTSHNPDHALILGGKVGMLSRDGGFGMGSAETILRTETLSKLFGVDAIVCQNDELKRKTCLIKM